MTYDYRSGAQKPKFKHDDEVQVMDGDEVLLTGKVFSVNPFDDFRGEFSYKVKDLQGGTPKTWSESRLRPAPKLPRTRRAPTGPLKPEDLQPGLLIEQIAHPEYGVWRVDRPARGTTGMWEISRSSGGGKVLDEDEAHFWRVARDR